MGKLEYLAVLGVCVLVTLPLELAGARVYRRPGRLVRAILPVALVFLVWDGIAIACGVWDYATDSLTGILVPFGIPLEEVLFFVVIPICGILTYETVGLIVPVVRRLSARRVRR